MNNYCLDDISNIVFNGKKGSEIQQGPLINVSMCKRHEYCKAEQEIRDFLRSAKIYVLVKA